MTTRLNPYITFQDTAREAMHYYQAVFGGELILHTFGEYGDPGAGFSADGVMHAQLETTNGYTIMASDAPPGMEATAGGNITISISGDDADILRAYFAKLADGGSIQMALETQIWGDEFGLTTDKFGVAWMINITDPA